MTPSDQKSADNIRSVKINLLTTASQQIAEACQLRWQQIYAEKELASLLSTQELLTPSRHKRDDLSIKSIKKAESSLFNENGSLKEAKKKIELVKEQLKEDGKEYKKLLSAFQEDVKGKINERIQLCFRLGVNVWGSTVFESAFQSCISRNTIDDKYIEKPPTPKRLDEFDNQVKVNTILNEFLFPLIWCARESSSTDEKNSKVALQLKGYLRQVVHAYKVSLKDRGDS